MGKPLTREEAMKNPKLAAAILEAEKPRQPSGNSGELDGASEKEVVSEIVTALRLQGYCTPREWKPGKRGILMRVGQLKAKGSGTDIGVPDLIVFPFEEVVPSLLMGGWTRPFFFEVKARTKAARESKEQTLLISLGIVHRVNSAAQVLAIIN